MCLGAQSAAKLRAFLRAFLMGHTIVLMQATTVACILQGCESMCQLGAAVSPALQQLHTGGGGDALHVEITTPGMPGLDDAPPAETQDREP
jgi:hypothetical protein